VADPSPPTSLSLAVSAKERGSYHVVARRERQRAVFGAGSETRVLQYAQAAGELCLQQMRVV